mmetsp:Transcript_11396/g.15333  ORF Transcript_11396/g.15333 Transcript_11396/m.15333 type:complete len:228 (+) Transcript_11396:522-1205(+)
MEGFSVCYTGGVAIEKELNALLVKDNAQNATMLQRIGGRLPANFPQHVLEDLKVRTLMTLGRNQKSDYFVSEENVAKMKSKRVLPGLGKTFKEDFPYLCISFYSRVTAMEACYGDPDEEEPNLAYSLCQSLLKMTHENRMRSAQNVMLVGGSTMIPGFRKRLIQEVKAMISERNEFEPLRSILQWLKVPEMIFAPNICSWVGASVLMSLGQEADRFLLTREQYMSEG